MTAKRFRVLAGILLTISCIFIHTPAHAESDTSLSFSIPPRPSDFQFLFAGTNQQTNVPHDTSINYQITYGAYSSGIYDLPATITVNYSQDTAPNGANLLDYVTGSATNAYDNTPPIIDPVARTITWEIPDLPAGTSNQSVDFQLQTNADFNGASTVNMLVSADMSNQYIALPLQYVTQNYIFNLPNSITPTQAPPTPTPLPANTPENVSNLYIATVSIPQILTNQAEVYVATSNPAKETLYFGTKPTQLDASMSTRSYTDSTTFTIPNLTPDTDYYFDIYALDRNNQQASSEVYHFRTASAPAANALLNSIVTVTSGDSVVSSNMYSPSSLPSPVTLPSNTSYTVFLVTKTQIPTSSITAVVTNSSGQIVSTIPFSQTAQNTYAASFQTPAAPSVYTVSAHIIYLNGNVISYPLSTFSIVNPFTIQNEQSGLGISQARIFVYILNPVKNTFMPINVYFPNIPNPVYTNLQGEIPYALPDGNFKAVIDAFGFTQKVITFSIEPGHSYPAIRLKPGPLDIYSYSQYILHVGQDFTSHVATYFENALANFQHFTVLGIVGLFWAGPLNFTLFSMRSKTKAVAIPAFLLFNLHRLANPNKLAYIRGHVTDSDGAPLSNCDVGLYNSRNGIVYMRLETNKLGYFYTKNVFNPNSTIIVCTKVGFSPAKVNLGDFLKSRDPMHSIILHGKEGNKQFAPVAYKSITHILGTLYEVSLLISFVLELFAIPVFGILHTIPFITLSFINWVVWLFYLHEFADAKYI